jgi:hypothetical protein
MSGRIDDVDPKALVVKGGIFGCDSDASFPLQINGVHEAFGNMLIGPEHPALFEHLVHKGGFPMIHMGDNGDISDGILFH